MSVIQFGSRKNNINTDLNTLLKIAVDMKEDMLGKEGEVVPDFDVHISGKIMEILIDRRMIEAEFIFCGMYISELLVSLYKTAPENWLPTDYVIEGCETNNPFAIQRGANICFLICSVFPTHLGRSMKIEAYKFFGCSLFRQYYNQTGKEIGFCMSKQFIGMTKVAQECINTI